MGNVATTLEKIKEQAIRTALKTYKGNITHTAKALDVSLHTVRKYKPKRKRKTKTRRKTH